MIARLEDRLSALRMLSPWEVTGWEPDPKVLQQEVERLRSRLLSLLRASDPGGRDGMVKP